MRLQSAALVLSLGVVACGPQSREEAGVVDAPPFGAEICNDGVDSDGDGNGQDGSFDCSDPDCSGVGECPLCEPPTAQPLALPDGNDENGGTCTPDATCGTNRCVAGFCANPYTSQAIWSSFADGTTL